jgi:hypothetical protein
MPLRTTSQPILPQRKGGVSLADLLQQLRRREPLTAEALEILASGHNAVVNTLRQPPPSLEDVTVTDPTGALIARIGSWVDGDRVRSGFWTREFYQGGLDPASAVLYSDESGQLIIGRNGSASVLDPYGDSAAWIGTQWDTLAVTGALDNGAGLIRLLVPLHTFVTGDEVLVDQVGGVPNATGVWTVTVIDPNTIDLQESGFGGAYTSGGWITRVLHVTGAADNGSGLIRLTVASHGYESGDRVHVENVGGVPNATGQWTVTVVDADHIDLEGSVFAGAHSGGGVCIRFFAGGLFQNIAIGPSFSDYRLRAFSDGTLRIRNAEIGLVSADGRISMDPDGPEIALEELPDGDEIVHLGRWYKGDGDPEDPANYWVGLYAKRAWFGGAGPGDASVLIDGPSITIKTLEAPNVLEGTTAEAYYCDVNGTETPTGRYYGFKGTITLPRTDPNYAHLRLVRAMVTHPAPSTLREDVRTVYRPDFTADVINWRSPWWPRPTADETFQRMEFECENGDSKITADPFAVSNIAVIGQAASPEDLPLLPLVVACSENPAERYSDAVNLTHMLLRPTAVLPPGHGALWISWWFSRDAGATWEWLGKYWTTETPAVDVLHPNDANPQSWLVKGATGNHAGDNGPDVAVVSAPFEIAGLSAIPADGATSITGATASYVVDYNQCPWAFYPTISWTAPPHESFFHTRLRVKLYNQAGELSPDPKYAGLGQEAGQWTNQGTQTYTEPYGWMLPPMDEPASGFRYFRLYLYAVTRANQETLCNAWAGGASYGTLTVTENRKVDPPGDGLEVVGGKYALKKGGDLDVDGSGNPILRLGVVQEENLFPGTLGADFSKWAGTKRPVGIYNSLPLYGDATAPDVIYNIGDGLLYRRSGGVWEKGTRAQDILAGTVASTVTITGTIYANRLIENGGGIDGCRLKLNLNGVIAEVANIWDDYYGGYAGIRVMKLNAELGIPSPWRTVISYNGIGIINEVGRRMTELSAGYLVLNDAAGYAKFVVNTTGPGIENVYTASDGLGVTGMYGAGYLWRIAHVLGANPGGSLYLASANGTAGISMAAVNDSVGLSLVTPGLQHAIRVFGSAIDGVGVRTDGYFDSPMTWQTPMRAGAYRLWIDSYGRLKLKYGAPSNDNDGVVVGTQL